MYFVLVTNCKMITWKQKKNKNLNNGLSSNLISMTLPTHIHETLNNFYISIFIFAICPQKTLGAIKNEYIYFIKCTNTITKIKCA